jgi:SAM-dependent MidA family methyltransferase
LQLAKSGQTIPPGTVMEQCPAARTIMRTLSARLKHHHGAAIVIDYGYLGDAHHDTLQALKSHQFYPVLREPGEADLTAHVDFSTLMQIARDSGLTVGPLLKQGEFLVRMGAEVRLEQLLKHAAPPQRDPLITGLSRLISPQAIGELSKVMAVSSSPTLDLPGLTA